jgi:phospholipid transport system transporter-binding protein
MLQREGDRLNVSGALTIDTVTALYDADLAADGNSALTVDLAQVEAVDSAAVSLLLSWLRRAQRGNVTLRFANIPANLLSLARVYGVDRALQSA